MYWKTSSLLFGIEFILQKLKLIVQVSGNQFSLFGEENILSIYQIMSLKVRVFVFISFDYVDNCWLNDFVLFPILTGFNIILAYSLNIRLVHR